MAIEVIDLTNYKDRFGSRVPEGRYLTTVEDIEVGTTRKGDTMWTVTLRVLGGDYDRHNLLDRLTMTERALFRTVGFLEGLGIKTERKRMRVNTANLIGKRVWVEVADGEPYNGTVRSEVRSYSLWKSTGAGDEFEDVDVEDLEDLEDEEMEEPAETKAKGKGKGKPAKAEEDFDDLDALDI